MAKCLNSWSSFCSGATNFLNVALRLGLTWSLIESFLFIPCFCLLILPPCVGEYLNVLLKKVLSALTGIGPRGLCTKTNNKERYFSLLTYLEPDYDLPAALKELPSMVEGGTSETCPTVGEASTLRNAKVAVQCCKMVYEDWDIALQIVTRGWEALPVKFEWVGGYTFPSIMYRHSQCSGDHHKGDTESIQTDLEACILRVPGEAVVIAFRGSEPLEAVDWMTDFTLYADDRTDVEWGWIHPGFRRNLGLNPCLDVAQGSKSKKAIKVDANGAVSDLSSDLVPFAHLLDEISHARKNKEQLFVTGHSLGGALALMFANAMCKKQEIKEHFGGLVTIGQPKVGGRQFTGAAAEILGTNKNPAKYLRIVDLNDVVPRVPPSGGTIYTDYSHFGTVVYQGADGLPVEGMVDEMPISPWSLLMGLTKTLLSVKNKFDPKYKSKDTWVRVASRFGSWIPLPFLCFAGLSDHATGDYWQGLNNCTQRQWRSWQLATQDCQTLEPCATCAEGKTISLDVTAATENGKTNGVHRKEL